MDYKTAALDIKIREMASRIRELRELEGKTVAEMAAYTDVTQAEYEACESGLKDLNFAFIYRCAQALNVNVTDIIEGISPNLKPYRRAAVRQEQVQPRGSGEGDRADHA